MPKKKPIKKTKITRIFKKRGRNIKKIKKKINNINYTKKPIQKYE